MARDYTKYLTWLQQEFLPLTLATPVDTQKQIVENAIRYFNVHSAYSVSTMVEWNGGVKRVQLNSQFKAVADVYPATTTSWVFEDMPIWTLLGVQVLDNITGDLIVVGESFRNYRVYLGKDFSWIYEKSEDPTIGGYLYARNVPSGSQALYVLGTKRITEDEDIKVEYILDWLYNYSKALLKQTEGNTLRKSGIINIQNDGQEMVNEGKEEADKLKERLAQDSRWIVFPKRC